MIERDRPFPRELITFPFASFEHVVHDPNVAFPDLANHQFHWPEPGA